MSYFENYARDAGFALAGLLLSRTLNFDLPSLVPYSFFKKLYETEGSIQLPSQLENRWILFLFALGWQCFTNNPIRASKEIDVDGCTYEAYDIDKVYNTYCGVLPKEKLEKIPKNIRCFNSKLKQDICLASVYAIDYLIDNKNDSQCFDSLISQLDNLPIGKKNASEYEALIASILFALFNPHLKNIERKTKENQGRGVVDITADNKAERGFFREIKDRYGIHSPIIFVECKNISYDFANDEANQIASRLGERQGLFGILACRSINNKNVALSRCKDILENDHKYVIVLEDSDFIKLLEKRKINDLNGIWEHLESKLKQIVLKQ
ncbi:MAG: hypothetical protein A2X49_11790 [Lentisphaerae bacterium GWF2_52_8]|nr:MAG: hypothetical protein A2X49_11790 [Lentisphaerae bacterium GWF2_52_8]